MSVNVAKQIEKGSVFFEHAYGEELQLTAKSTPTRNDDGQWEWEAVTNDGRDVHYLITEGYEHYGPNITLTSVYS